MDAVRSTPAVSAARRKPVVLERAYGAASVQTLQEVLHSIHECIALEKPGDPVEYSQLLREVYAIRGSISPALPAQLSLQQHCSQEEVRLVCSVAASHA